LMRSHTLKGVLNEKALVKRGRLSQVKLQRLVM
jgi:hypothetical protein